MEGSTTVAIVAVMFTAATLLLHVVVAVRSGQWSMPDRLAAMEKRLNDAITQTRKDVETDLNQVQANFGETVTAMQQKIHEFETWTRDTFVRRDSFALVTKENREATNALSDRLSGDIGRLEIKIDQIIGREIDRRPAS